MTGSETATPLPANLYRAAQARALDAAAINDFHIPGMTLMESAGSAAWQLLLKVWPVAGRITVICGAGNNAGDGYVVARLAAPGLVRRAGGQYSAKTSSG